MKERKWYRISDIAEEYELSKSTIAKWIRQGRLAAIQIKGVWHVDELEFTTLISRKKAQEQPCWYCQLAGKSKCEWDAFLKPVPGWEATPVNRRYKTGAVHSYKITYCPKFVEDD